MTQLISIEAEGERLVNETPLLRAVKEQLRSDLDSNVGLYAALTLRRLP